MKPITRLCSSTAVALLLALSAQNGGASQTYYRWVDESGTPVSSDRPPPAGIKYEVITTETNTRVEEGAGETDSRTPATNSQDQAAASGGGSLPRIEIVKDPEACKIARQNLETLNTHARIRMADEDGNIRYLNEDEKAVQRAQAEAAIKQNCD